MSDNPIIDLSQLSITLSDYQVGKSQALTDSALLPLVRNYKRTVASRLYPLSAKDIADKVSDAQYHVSRKIDGEFNVLIYKDGILLTLNPGGTIRTGLPWMTEAKQLLDNVSLTNVMIAGELYVDTPGRRPRVHDVVSVARQPKTDEELASLRFGVFDILSINDQPLDQPYAETWNQIESAFSTGKHIHPVETVSLKGPRSIETQFEQWVTDEGAEGLVVRSDTAGSFKVKPRHNIDAMVIGFTESTGEREGMLHDLLLGVVRPDGSIHTMARVGGGFSDQQRQELLVDLQGMIVDSEYAEVNSDHVAYRMVEPNWVIEISCLDMISQNTRGGSVDRMVLNYNADERRYEVVRRMPLVSVISPQFIRIRDDKSFDATDARISQVSDLVDVPAAALTAAELATAKSEIEKRAVYLKPYRGQTSIRKFLMWKTNKEDKNSDFPAYVIHYTDFSPSRKKPLDREVRVSNSKEQIDLLWDQLIQDNIKKGWKIHESGAEE